MTLKLRNPMQHTHDLSPSFCFRQALSQCLQTSRKICLLHLRCWRRYPTSGDVNLTLLRQMALALNQYLDDVKLWLSYKSL